jgi:hypothetical protein
MRNNAIDFVKGFMVVGMVVGHTLDYFVVGWPLLYDYVYYVGTGFIFFSGIMCGTVYLEKFKKDRKYVSLRLLVRGLKLFALFFVLNILIHLAVRENYTGQRLGINLIFDNLGSILLGGNSALMAFEILLPISYILLLSILLLHSAKYKYPIYVLLISVICVLSLSHIRMPYNLLNGLFGVVGFYTGLICTELKSRLRSKFTGIAVTLILSLYLFVLYPRGVNVEGNLILFFIYVNIITAASYLLGSFLKSYWVLPRILIKFGRYSLYLYLAHIVFLQILYRLGVSRGKFIPVKTYTIIVAVCCLLAALSYLTDYVRGRFSIADKVYRFIFA